MKPPLRFRNILCVVAVLMGAGSAFSKPTLKEALTLEQAQRYARGGDWTNTQRAVTAFLDGHADYIGNSEELAAMNSIFQTVRGPWSDEEAYKGTLQRIEAALRYKAEAALDGLKVSKPGASVEKIIGSPVAFDGAESKKAFIANVKTAFPGSSVAFVDGPVRPGLIPVKYDSQGRVFTFHQGLVKYLENPQHLAAMAKAEDTARREMDSAARMGTNVTDEMRQQRFLGLLNEAQKAAIPAAYNAVSAIMDDQKGETLAAAAAAAASTGVGPMMVQRFKDSWEKFNIKGFAGAGNLYKNPITDGSPTSSPMGGLAVSARVLPLVPFFGRNVVTDKIFTDIEHYEFYGTGNVKGQVLTFGAKLKDLEVFARYRNENYPGGSEINARSVGIKHKIIDDRNNKVSWGYELFKPSNVPFEGPVIGAFNAAHPDWPRVQQLKPNNDPNHLDLGYILSLDLETDLTRLVPDDFPLLDILSKTLHINKTKAVAGAKLGGSTVVLDDPESGMFYAGVKFLFDCRVIVGIVSSYGTDFSSEKRGYRDNSGKPLKDVTSTMAFIEIPFERGVDQCEKTPSLPRVQNGPFVVKKIETFHQLYRSGGAGTPVYRNGDEAQSRTMVHGVNVQIDKGPYELSASAYDIMGNNGSAMGLAGTLAYNLTSGLALEVKGLHEDGLNKGLNELGVGVRLRPIFDKNYKITLEFVKTLTSNVPSVIRANQIPDAPNRSWYASATASAKIYGFRDWATLYGLIGAGVQGSGAPFSPDSFTYGIGTAVDFGPQEKPYVGINFPIFGAVTQNTGMSSGVSPVKALGQGGLHDSPITLMVNALNIYDRFTGKTAREAILKAEQEAAAKQPPVPVFGLGDKVSAR